MSNLIPEKRTDKNGKTSTRWVKPSTQGSAASKLPSPVLVQEDAYAEPLDYIAKHCKGYDFDGELFEEQLPEAVRNMPKDYAERFSRDFEMEAGASDLAYDIAEETIAVFGPESTIDPEARVNVLSNFLSIIPEYYEGKDNEGTYSAHFARIVFRSVKGHERAELFSDDERVAIQAATDITETVFPTPIEGGDFSNEGYTVEGGMVWLTDNRSVKLLIENVGVIDRLKEELMSRKTFHPDVVGELVKNGVLAEGSL